MRVFHSSPNQNLREQFVDRLTGPIIQRIGDLYRASDRAHVFFFPIDPERFVNRRVQVAHGHDAARNVVALLVARSDHLAGFDAAARSASDQQLGQ